MTTSYSSSVSTLPTYTDDYTATLVANNAHNSEYRRRDIETVSQSSDEKNSEPEKNLGMPILEGWPLGLTIFS